MQLARASNLEVGRAVERRAATAILHVIEETFATRPPRLSEDTSPYLRFTNNEPQMPISFIQPLTLTRDCIRPLNQLLSTPI